MLKQRTDKDGVHIVTLCHGSFSRKSLSSNRKVFLSIGLCGMYAIFTDHITVSDSKKLHYWGCTTDLSDFLPMTERSAGDLPECTACLCQIGQRLAQEDRTLAEGLKNDRSC